MSQDSYNNIMPNARCAHCGEEFQIDDYHELEEGEEVKCPDCDGVMYVTEIYSLMHVTLGTSETQERLKAYGH